MSRGLFANSLYQRKFVKLNTIVKPHSLKSRNIKKKTALRSSGANSVGQATVSEQIKVQKLHLGSSNPMTKELLKSAVNCSKISINSCSKQEVKYNFHDSKIQIESLLLERWNEVVSSTLSQNALRQMVKNRALEIAHELGVPRRNFKASKKWLNDFLKRCERLGYINDKCYSADVKNTENLQVQLASCSQTTEPQKLSSIKSSNFEASVNELPCLGTLFSKSSVTDNLNRLGVQKSKEQVPDLLCLFSSSTNHVQSNNGNAFSLQSDHQLSGQDTAIPLPLNTSVGSYEQNHITTSNNLHPKYIRNNLYQSESATARYFRKCARRSSRTKYSLISRQLLRPEKTGCKLTIKSSVESASHRSYSSNIPRHVYDELFTSSMSLFGNQLKVDEKSSVPLIDETDSGYRSRSLSKIADDDAVNDLADDASTLLNYDENKNLTDYQIISNSNGHSFSSCNKTDGLGASSRDPLMDLFNTGWEKQTSEQTIDSLNLFTLSESDELMDFDVSDLTFAADEDEDSASCVFSDSDIDFIESLLS